MFGIHVKTWHTPSCILSFFCNLRFVQCLEFLHIPSETLFLLMITSNVTLTVLGAILEYQCQGLEVVHVPDY